MCGYVDNPLIASTLQYSEKRFPRVLHLLGYYAFFVVDI